MYPNYNHRRYEQLVKINEQLYKDGKQQNITKEVLDLWDAKQLFLKSEIGSFKIYQN